MSLAVLYALARPLSLRVRGLGRVTQLGLTLNQASRKRCLLSRMAVWEAMAVRGCSGPTTFRKHTFIAKPEDDSQDKNTLEPLTFSDTHQTEPHTSANSNPDFLLPSQYQQHQSDLLMGKIRECESVSVAFQVYERHKDVMDARHCLTLFRRLGEFVHKRIDDRIHIVEAQEFESLCNHIFIKCRRMDVEDCVHLLKSISRLELDSGSKLTLAVLQMIKNQINSLSLKQLIFLEFLLRKMALTPLCDALLTAIPILMSNGLTSHVTELSFTELSQAFNICCYGKVAGTGTILQEIYCRGSVRDPIVAMSLVWALTRLSSPNLQRKLLTQEEQLTRDVIMKESLETMAREVNSLSHKQMETTLSKLSEGYGYRDRSCYNERFLHESASYVCHHSFSFEKAAHIIFKLFKMNFLSDKLGHYVVNQILTNPEIVPESRVGMLPIISTITALNLPEKEMKAALDIVMTHKSLQMDLEYYRKPLLVVALDLLSADYYNTKLMDILTSSDTLSLYMSKYHKEDRNHCKLVEVDQYLGEVLHSTKRVPDIFLEPGRKLLSEQRPSRSSLKAILTQILDEPTNLISGVVTEGGLHIDHLLVLDPEGVSIKLRNDDVALMKNPCITSLDVPSNATKLAILDVGSSITFRPTNVLKGPHRLRQKVLEAQGFKVLPLLQSVIFQHHNEEKMLYVKRELEEAGVMT